MKLPPARVAAFLREPGDAAAVLLYGADAGLVRERADALARAVCPDLRDPFRVADLAGVALAADPARLADEAAQIGLMGGTRVVRVRDATDALASTMARYLATPAPDALVVAEAGELPNRSPLRRAVEEASRGVAIACYPDTARDLVAVIRESLGAHRVSVARDAIDFLVEHLGNDRLVTRSELDKLALYAGDGGRIELDDARAAIADAAALALDDAVFAAAEGDLAALDRALARAFAEGETAVSTVRAALRHAQRLHLLVARVAAGTSREAAMQAARPPIFFKQQESFRRQLARWREAPLRRQLDALAEAEMRMKTTGLPAEPICRAALVDFARAAGDRIADR